MKIIEDGNTKWAKRIKCKSCKVVLEVEASDLEYEVTEAMALAQQYCAEIKGHYFVLCPHCELKLIIKDVPPLVEKQIKVLNSL
jgi:DNA-directed RNA polymerase subunit RPC12/RpoP